MRHFLVCSLVAAACSGASRDSYPDVGVPRGDSGEAGRDAGRAADLVDAADAPGEDDAPVRRLDVTAAEAAPPPGGDSGSCGMPGQPCCPGGTCAAGGCCQMRMCVAPGGACGVDPGTCEDGRCSGCGRPGQPCCPTSAGGCYENGVLCDYVGGTGVCSRCGVEGNRCCADKCMGDLVCNTSTGRCIACGGAGQDCCPFNLQVPRCRGAGLACGGDFKCAPCGERDQPCCVNAPGACKSGLLCRTVGLADLRCQPCGTAGLPCCSGSQCSDGSCCTQNERGTLQCVGRGQICPGRAGGVCDGDTCSGCGGAGGPCCATDGITLYCAAAGHTCIATYTPTMVTGRCQPCGKDGQPCCRPSPNTTTEGTCLEEGFYCSSGMNVCVRRGNP